jgi:hypothetical protein
MSFPCSEAFTRLWFIIMSALSGGKCSHKKIFRSVAHGGIFYQEICSNTSKIYRLIKVMTVCREEGEAYKRCEELQISQCW